VRPSHSFFFTDHSAELGKLVREGRRREFAHFAAFADPQRRRQIPDPNAPETFNASCITPVENEWMAFYQTCLAIRHKHIIPRMPGCKSLGASAVSDTAIRAAWRMNDGAVLTLATNFGTALVSCTTTPPLFSTSAQLHTNAVPAYTTIAWLQAP